MAGFMEQDGQITELKRLGCGTNGRWVTVLIQKPDLRGHQLLLASGEKRMSSTAGGNNSQIEIPISCKRTKTSNTVSTSVLYPLQMV